MTQLTFIEKINKDYCDYLLQLTDDDLINVIYDYDNTIDENGKKWNVDTYIKQVKSYLKKIKKNNYSIRQYYKYSRQQENKGRIFVKGFGVQSLQYKLRGALLKNICYDYDMVSCHIYLVLYLAKKYIPDSKYPNIEYYRDNKDIILASSGKTKQDILKMLNDKKIYKFKDMFLQNLENEFKDIQNKLFEINPYDVKTENKNNIKGSILNMNLCCVENEILQKCINYCKKNKIAVYTPMFDGMTIETNNLIDKFNEISIEYGVKWIIKPHNTDIELDYELLEYNEFSYFNLKNKLEKQWFYLKNPVCFCEEYINIDDEKEIILRQRKDFLELTASYTDENDKHIYDEWIKDDNKRCYDKLDFIPFPDICPNNIYNTFTGLKGDNLIGEFRSFEKILYHIKILVGFDENGYEYILNYLAHLIQKPSKRPDVAILFKSKKEGVGKDLFFNYFEKYFINKEYCLATSKLEQIIGRFPLISNKLIIRINEISGKETFNGCEGIKDVITAEYCNIERKGIDAVKTRNCGRYIFFSNNDIPIKIGLNDRRFVCFDCSNKYANNKNGYIDELLTELDNKDSMYSFYQFLKNKDISNFSIIKRPITKFYKDLQQSNIPIIAKFLQDKYDFVNNKSIDIIQSSNLYLEFNNYLQKFHKDIQYTNNKFSRDIIKYNGISKKKTTLCYIFVININQVIDYLKVNKYYDYVDEYISE